MTASLSAGESLVALLALLGLTSFACRAGGYWLMGRIAVSDRFAAALRQAPLAVMIGIVAPAAVRGSPAELAGLAAVVVAMRLQRSDLVGALAGVAVVALVRAFG